MGGKLGQGVGAIKRGSWNPLRTMIKKCSPTSETIRKSKESKETKEEI